LGDFGLRVSHRFLAGIHLHTYSEAAPATNSGLISILCPFGSLALSMRKTERIVTIAVHMAFSANQRPVEVILHIIKDVYLAYQDKYVCTSKQLEMIIDSSHPPAMTECKMVDDMVL
jgi:hypothetical protein